MRNEKVLNRVNEGNILHKIKRIANWNGHFLRGNCFLKRVIGGKINGRIEVTGRRGKRCRQLLDNLVKREHTGNWKRMY